ncbi:MAG: RTX toxin [Vicinamibacteria bacterium]
MAPQAIGGPHAVQGPGPSQNGQVDGIPGRPVTGAVNALAAHPTNADILYLGAVNGGIWRTTDATAAEPTWVPLTDALPSLSIGRGALQLDPTDPAAATIVAGSGQSSSIGDGGARTGLLRSTDSGTTWSVLDGGGTLAGKNSLGVAARGSVLLFAANNNNGDPFDLNNVGIYRSTDTGATFTRVSGSAGLPLGRAFDVAADPSSLGTFYTVVRDAGAANGVYKTTDTGGTWSMVSTAAMAPTFVGNAKVSVGTANDVYVAGTSAGILSVLYRSGNGGASWASLDLPVPTIHPGGQGGVHMSLVASRTNANVVFIGGDRQDSPFPNDVGASNFTGRLFRIDASLPPGSQAQHITHSSAVGPPGGGTANNSAPHADSRVMVFDANGNLVEGDDGGVYLRTVPANDTGVWRSLVGNLVATEFHGIAFDSNTDTVFGGTQDNGTPQQVTPGNPVWSSISTGDGGDVGIDDVSAAGQSVRYSSFQFLQQFRRRTYDSAGTLLSVQNPALTVTSGPPFQAQFYTPVEVNERVGTRLVLGGGNGAYESLNRGDTVVQIGTTLVNRNAIAYGGRRLEADAPDVLYVGSGAQVLVRTGPAGPLALSAYAGGEVTGIALNPEDWHEAYATDAAAVHRTTDAGATWTNVTYDLPTFGTGRVRTAAFIRAGPGAVMVGTDRGVYGLKLDGTSWDAIGTGLPNAPVAELDYDVARDKLTAGLLGRGAWTLNRLAPHVPVGLLTYEVR